MHRTGRSLTIPILALILIAGSILSAAPARAQTPPPQAAAPPDWSAVKAAVAKIDVLGAGGSTLHQTYGFSLGEPARLIVRLSDLAGAEKIVATFPDQSTVTSTRVLATDPMNDIAVLEPEGVLPLTPEIDSTIKWQYQEKISVIPGPGMSAETPELACGEPVEFDRTRIVPLAMDHPAGLPVMHICGRWIGMTGVLRDPSGQFVYMTPKESIVPLLLEKKAAKPIAEIAQNPPDWMKPSTARGLFARGALTSFSVAAEAEPFFNLALQRDATIPELHFWMGKNYFKQQGKYAEAETSFREAGRLRPTWPQAFFMAGAAAFQQKKFAEAVQIYDEGLKTNPKSAMIMSNKAAALGNLGRIDEATQTLKAAIAADPSYSMAIFNLGGLYLQTGKRLEAEEQYTKLLQIDKNLAQQLRMQLDSK
jgi:Flp pilus assembly protein TadD